MSKCKICGADGGGDLYMSVTNSKVCCVCIADVGCEPTEKGIAVIRERLGLKEGEYYSRSDEETMDILRGVVGRR